MPEDAPRPTVPNEHEGRGQIWGEIIVSRDSISGNYIMDLLPLERNYNGRMQAYFGMRQRYSFFGTASQEEIVDTLEEFYKRKLEPEDIDQLTSFIEGGAVRFKWRFLLLEY